LPGGAVHFSNGHVQVPDGPGFGLVINEDDIRNLAAGETKPENGAGTVAPSTPGTARAKALL